MNVLDEIDDLLRQQKKIAAIKLLRVKGKPNGERLGLKEAKEAVDLREHELYYKGALGYCPYWLTSSSPSPQNVGYASLFDPGQKKLTELARALAQLKHQRDNERHMRDTFNIICEVRLKGRK